MERNRAQVHPGIDLKPIRGYPWAACQTPQMTDSGVNAMNFKPLGDRLLVQREAEPTVSAGGIIIPDSAQEKPLRGRVLAVGPGKSGDDGSIRPVDVCLLYTSPSPRDATLSRMPSSA